MKYEPAGSLEMSIFDVIKSSLSKISTLLQINPLALIRRISVKDVLPFSNFTVTKSFAGLGLMLRSNSDELISSKPLEVQGTAK
jgi:hypothetical protein